VQQAVANDLVKVPATDLAAWLESLRPVRATLRPPLVTIFREAGRRDGERSLATDILADYAADQPQLLADLLLDADDKQFAVIYPKLQQRGDEALPLLAGEIDKQLPAELPSSDERREKLARRQANAAVALLRMNRSDKVWPLLKHSPDPRLRSYLIHRFGPLGADSAALVKRLEEEPDVTIRRALILSLGPEEFGPQAWAPEGKQRLVERLQEVYRTAADPGLHAAAEWLLRQWGQGAWLQQVNDGWAQDGAQRQGRLDGIGQLLTKGKGKAPQWYVNGQGQTMVVVPGPVEFLMGSPAAEEGHLPPESQHKRRIGRTFALAAKPVTVGEFQRFVRASRREAWFEAGGQAAPYMKKLSPVADGPIILVDWYHAAAYCNWLSEQEGIAPEQWCYETDAQRLWQQKVGATVLLLTQRDPLRAAAGAGYFLEDRRPQVTALRKGYLSLRGYRLPSEAEWEYACRAGALTSRHYGEAEELLPRYAWYQKNAGVRTWPVGGKKPNDLGLFDLHGNVYTWCQEQQAPYPGAKAGEAVEDKEDGEDINNDNNRVLRGGSFDHRASYARCADRNRDVPSLRATNIGFRPARTFTP
jgi:formylglycine-generating enzyme required for sulfatase activity